MALRSEEHQELSEDQAVKNVQKAYGCTEDIARGLVKKYTWFANSDHEQAVDAFAKAYNCSPSQAKDLVLKNPNFARRNYSDNIAAKKFLQKAFGYNEREAAEQVRQYPQFALRHHDRAIQRVLKAYGCTRADAIAVIRKHPRFESYDHEKKLRQLKRLGRLIGLDEDAVKTAMLEHPALVGLSIKRHIAAMDATTYLVKGDDDRAILLQRYLRGDYINSPFVRGREGLRITKAAKLGLYEHSVPPLMAALRRHLRLDKEKAQFAEMQKIPAK